VFAKLRKATINLLHGAQSFLRSWHVVS